MTVIAAIKGTNRKIWRRIRKKGWCCGWGYFRQDGYSEMSLLIGRWESWLCRKSITDTESQACKPKAQLCWGHKSGNKLVEMWRARDVDMQWDRCHPEMCWPEEGLGYWKSNEKDFNWDGSALCHQHILAAGTRENLKNFAGERKQGQLLADNWVIGES